MVFLDLTFIGLFIAIIVAWLSLQFIIASRNQCCTPPYFKKLGGVFPKYAAAAAYAGVESSELFQIFVPCTRFAILYIFVKSKFWQLIRTIFNVLDNRFMIIVSKTFSLN